jgi:hypothetical protein
MSTAIQPSSRGLAPVLPGLCLGVLTMLYGFGLGGLFGLNEEIIKGRLSADAAAVAATAYGNDQAKAQAVVDKSWAYMQRAHLHAGSLGTAAIALSALLVLLGTGAGMARLVSLGLGAGSLGYSVFWMLAGFRAPGMGSTGAAKESLQWLAVPSAGLVLLGTVTVLALLVRAMLRGEGGTDGAR